MPHADNLKRRASGIGQRTQQIEGGADAQLAPNMSDASGCSVKEWRKNETDPLLVQAAFDSFGGGSSVNTQCLENVRASAK